LRDLVENATPTSSLALASTSGTIANFTSSTANITLGTIPTLTTGTTTSTNEVVTNGTITNLSATTSTFLGTITGSTNVVNIGSGQIYKDASGRVGIGTASPDASYRMTVSGSRSVVGPGILFTDSDATPTNYGLYINANKSFTIYDSTAGANRLLVDSSGNVGVGTASPTAQVTISKVVNSATLPSASANHSISLYPPTTTGYYGGGISWSEGANTAANICAVDDGASGALGIVLSTGNNSAITERLRIDSSGNVGIGQSSLTSTLTVNKAGADTTIQMQEGGVNTAQISSYQSSMYLTVAGSNNIIFRPNSTEAMRINSSGNVGIGTTSINAKLVVSDGANGLEVAPNVSSSTVTQLTSYNRSTNAYTTFNFDALTTRFSISGTEALRIDSSGNLLVGKTSPSTSTVGFQFTPSDNKVACGAASGPSAFFNRNTDDGIIVQIAQDGTVEGTISVSGTTVSYNGGHLSRFSQLPSGQRDPAIKKGTVLSNLDAMCEWRDADGNLLPNEQLNKVKISDVEGDLNTAGVFVNWDNDDQDNPFDLNMAMTGDMIIRIAQGTSVNRGDLLMSAGDGTAKPQGDDIIRSKTIAKVTSTNVTCTYEDGSYCVPCVLMAC